VAGARRAVALRDPNARTDRVDGEISTSLRVAHFYELQRPPAHWEDIPRRQWPSFDDLAAGAPAPQGPNVEAGHPPLYYLLLAPLDAALDGLSFPTEILWLRMFSVLLVAPAVWLTFEAVRLVFPRTIWTAVAGGAFVAAIPQLAHIAASINNDTLMISLSAAVLYVTTRIVLQGASKPLLVWGSALAAAGVLTKATGLVMLLVFAAGVGWATLRRRDARLLGALAVLAPVAVAGAWYGLRVAGHLPVEPVEPRATVALHPHAISVVTYVHRVAFHLTFRTFWGRFGWLAVPLPSAWYHALTIGTAAGFLVSAGALVVALVKRRLEPGRVVAGTLAVAAVALIVSAMLRSSLHAYRLFGEPRGLQGRYLFPVAGVIGAMLLAGVVAVAGRFRNAVGVAILSGGAALVIEGLYDVVRGFYGGPGTTLHLASSRLSAFSPLSGASQIVLALAALAVACAAAVAVLSVRSGGSGQHLVEVTP
jgi:4-amino-4-deoxy-L-arabinose transferase-like glycosyltransferase